MKESFKKAKENLFDGDHHCCTCGADTAVLHEIIDHAVELEKKLEKVREALKKLSRPYSEDIEDLSTIEWVIQTSEKCLKELES